MKKATLLLALLFIIISNIYPASLLQKSMADTTEYAAVLPASLITIENEAFEGTAVKVVALSGRLVNIGDRAFADNPSLIKISIPQSVESIADNAFDGSVNLIIHGVADSYVASWADEHNITFAESENTLLWFQKLGKLLRESFIFSFGFNSFCSNAVLWRRRRTETVLRSMRPQDRPELYPINYKFP